MFFNILFNLRLIGTLTVFKQFSDKILITLDESEYLNSHKIYCRNYSTKKHSNESTEYFYNFLRIIIVTHGKNIALPLTTEFITQQDRDEK